MGFETTSVSALILMMLGIPCHSVNCPPFPSSGVDFIDFKLRSGQWFNIILDHMKTSQIGTFEKNGAHLAIDKDPNTAAVACNPCDHSLKVGPAWWMIHLARHFLVAAVRLQANSKQYDANYLQDFEVKVMDNGSDCCICGNYRTNPDVAPLIKITVVCQQPHFVNQVKISRTRNSPFRPDAISIAEIEIFSAALVKMCS